MGLAAPEGAERRRRLGGAGVGHGKGGRGDKRVGSGGRHCWRLCACLGRPASQEPTRPSPGAVGGAGRMHTRLIQQEVRVHREGPLDWAILVDLCHDLLLAAGDAIGTASCKETS